MYYWSGLLSSLVDTMWMPTRYTPCFNLYNISIVSRLKVNEMSLSDMSSILNSNSKTPIASLSSIFPLVLDEEKVNQGLNDLFHPIVQGQPVKNAFDFTSSQSQPIVILFF